MSFFYNIGRYNRFLRRRYLRRSFRNILENSGFWAAPALIIFTLYILFFDPAKDVWDVLQILCIMPMYLFGIVYLVRRLLADTFYLGDLISLISIVAALILIYATIYQCIGIFYLNKAHSPTPLEAIYFSIVTWTTLGYGEFTPSEDNLCRMVAASEALFGYLNMALLIAVVQQLLSQPFPKERYRSEWRHHRAKAKNRRLLRSRTRNAKL